jgi:hypothetical protein
VSCWEYLGCGYLDPGDVLLTAGVEASRRGPPTYATWSLAAGVDIYTLSRRMGTSLQMIDRTYGHLAAGADVWQLALLDGFDSGAGARMGAIWALRTKRGDVVSEKTAHLQEWSQAGSNRGPPACK